MAVKKEELLSVNRQQVLAFRLHHHNLTERLSAGAVVEAARTCGVRNSPPGSAELALNMRVTDFSPAQFEKALVQDKVLLEAWALRASPLIFPANALADFMLGMFPTDEAALQFYAGSALATIKQAQMNATTALEIIAETMLAVLDGQNMTKGELSSVLNQRVPPKLLYWCKGCQASHIPESFFRIAAQKAQICFAPRVTAETLLTRSDQLLGVPLTLAVPSSSQAAMVRRYLHCYGPTSHKDFAKWAGISPKQAQQQWQLIQAEMVEVRFEGQTAWLLKKDLAILENPPEPAKIRLLPPYDAYLTLSDRETLLPDKHLHKEVWRVLGNPGVVLVEGEISGTWRPQKKGKRLVLNIGLFHALSPQSRTEIETEAELLAPFKGCTSSEVQYQE